MEARSGPLSAVSPIRLLIAGGGTGGHIYPGLAVFDRLKRDRPGSEALWVGTSERMEARLVPEAGIDIEFIRVAGFQRSFNSAALMKNLANAGRLASLAPVRRALRIVRRFRPHALLGTGGYVCGPVFLAAAIADVPGMLLEPNAEPGLTNRLVARLGVKIGAAFEETAGRFPRPENVIHTGIPVLPFHAGDDRSGWFDEMGLDPAVPLVLVTGGSQGARDLNRAVAEAVGIARRDDRFLGGYQILHQTGDALHRETAALIEGGTAGYKAVPYIKDMAAAMRRADVVVSRAGAATLAQITTAGRASILAPYPFAANDHQTANARAMEKAGAAIAIESRTLNGVRLAKEMNQLIQEEGRRAEMAAASGRLGLIHKKAADRVVAELLSLAWERSRQRNL